MNPETVSNCIDYLDEHPEAHCCDGAHIFASYDSEKSEWIYQSGRCFTSLKRNPLDRLSDMANNPGYSLYSIHRNSTHRLIYNTLIQSQIFDLKYGEKFLELADAILGCVNVINNAVLNIRDFVNFYDSTSNTRSNESSCYRYFYNKKYAEYKFNEVQVDK